MASLIAPTARTALLPRAARSSVRASRSVKTSATSKKQGSESQVQVEKRTEGQQQPSAVGRTNPSQLQRVAPMGALAPMSPFSDFGVLTPTVGRVGGLLRSIEQEMDSMMQVDIEDKKKEILIRADMPGLTGKDIHVAFDPETHLLILSGERMVEKDESSDESGFVRMERRFGRFERRFKLPANVDGDNIKAKVTHGVLKVHIPKTDKPETKEKKIEVETHQQ